MLYNQFFNSYPNRLNKFLFFCILKSFGEFQICSPIKLLRWSHLARAIEGKEGESVSSVFYGLGVNPRHSCGDTPRLKGWFTGSVKKGLIGNNISC